MLWPWAHSPPSQSGPIPGAIGPLLASRGQFRVSSRSSTATVLGGHLRPSGPLLPQESVFATPFIRQGHLLRNLCRISDICDKVGHPWTIRSGTMSLFRTSARNVGRMSGRDANSTPSTAITMTRVTDPQCVGELLVRVRHAD